MRPADRPGCESTSAQGHAQQTYAAGRYNISVYPEVRVYADPFEGLTVQLTELRGLIKIVPPLIDADRER